MSAVAIVLSLGGDVSVVDVDADGYFAGEPKFAGQVFAGPGVRFVAWDEASRRILGRLTDPSADASVWAWDSRSETYALHRLRTIRGETAQVDDALHAIQRRLEWWGYVGLLRKDTRADAWIPPEPAPAASPSGEPRPAEAGLDLAAWAPAGDGIFARFRSVEAAYRFLSQADAFLGVIPQADGRNWGTLRLALHDLLLPTIWRANPAAERGVSELGVYIEPPVGRGRLSVAVVFRVVDAELHRMQTTAGIALESKPDHMWRPPDDPFPAERERRNFRRRVADVEVVASDERLCERIAGRMFRPLIDDAQYAASRKSAVGVPSAPAADEAMFLFNSNAWPRGHRSPAELWLFHGLSGWAKDERPIREVLGVRWLALKWTGVPGAIPFRASTEPASLDLAYFRTVRIRTDVRGATIEMELVDSRAADEAKRQFDFIAAESPEARELATQRAATVCGANRFHLLPLALVENPQDDVAERNFVVLGWKPVCPCGGTYSVHPVTREVSCSVHGTSEAPRPGKWTPPPISDIKVDGSELSFRLAIDWNRQE